SPSRWPRSSPTVQRRTPTDAAGSLSWNLWTRPSTPAPRRALTVAPVDRDPHVCRRLIHLGKPATAHRRATVNVSLTPELEDLVHARVRSGRYTSASEVVREALRLLADWDELRDLRVQEVRAQVAEGLRAAEAGDVHP